MKKIYLLPALLPAFIGLIQANGNVTTADGRRLLSPQDSISAFVLDEIIVTPSSSLKETNKLRTLPASVSTLSSRLLSARQATTVKDVSLFVPNFYMPDYGAKLTSAVYIRGVGARSSGQSVALYVDDAPYPDKSSFDFELADVRRIEVLRGPQGTLYGRNALGGIIHVYTLSPLDYQGSKASLSCGNYGRVNAGFSTHIKPGERFGISAGAYYNHCDGFFTNTYNNRKADAEDVAGGNLKLCLTTSPAFTASYSASFEHASQGAFPYGLYREDLKTTAEVNFNDPSSYRRSLLSHNLSLRYRNENILIASTSGYQWLDDEMKIDQDFSAASLFVLNQRQKQHAFTEELSMKSLHDGRYQWSFGAHGFYNRFLTDAPVTFKDDGIKTLLQPVFDRLSGSGMPGRLTIADESLHIPGNFRTPSHGAAIYHQSTCNDLFTEGLSLTAGVRLDCEKQALSYLSRAKMHLLMQTAAGRPPVDLSERYPESVVDEKIAQEFRQLLPKIALKYACTPRTFVWLSAAKGYKAGGYNVQMSADIMQSLMQFDVMNAFMDGVAAPPPLKDVAAYRPETSWNYEAGLKSEPVNDRLRTEVAFFYMDIRDLLITRFVESGNGRVLSNAGRAESYGAELSVFARLSDDFAADLNYGYTHAAFLDYNSEKADYKGKYIPYTPQHTLSIGLQYSRLLRNFRPADRISASVQCNGAGRIYWTEENTISQPFYAIVNAQAGVHKDVL